jgi:hypothetical protein
MREIAVPNVLKPLAGNNSTPKSNQPGMSYLEPEATFPSEGPPRLQYGLSDSYVPIPLLRTRRGGAEEKTKRFFTTE